MSRTRVGIVGAGWVATARHIPGYRTHPDAEVAILYDRHPDRARTVAARAGIPRWSVSLDELFDSVDLVSLCTPPWTHAELAIAALQHGVHVFTEKPMAMNADEAASMAGAASDAQRLLCVSHNFLYSRAVRRADALIRRTGQPTYGVGMQMSSLRRRLPAWYAKLPGGLLFDELPHMLYTLQHFLGPLRVEHVRATRRDGEEIASAEIQLGSNAGAGQVLTVFESPISEWHVGLLAPGGAIDVDLFRDICVFVRPDGEHKAGDILRTSSRAVAEHAKGFAASGVRLVGRRLYWGHDALIREFVDAVRAGGPSPVPIEASVEIVQLTDQVLVELGAR